jgi:lysophospholipase L1-like esterase
MQTLPNTCGSNCHEDRAWNSHTAKNTTISNAITALGDPKVRYIDPNAWTEMAVNTPGFRDGLHFDVDGYDALLTRMLVALPAALA